MELPGKIKIITFANKKYNSCRSFIFIENDLINMKIRDTKKLIEHNAARIIFKPLPPSVKKRHSGQFAT